MTVPRRGVRWAALLCAVFVPAFAATPAPPVPLLWKVSDQDNSVYLLGSFHLLRKDDHPLSPDVDAAFADAERVVFEVAPEELGSRANARRAQRAASRTDRSRLDGDLTPALRAKFDAWAGNNAGALRMMGFPPERLQTLEPWLASQVVTVIEARRRGLVRASGLDASLANAAKAARKPTSGLESGASQIAMLDGLPRATQLAMLERSLPSEGEELELDRLHRDWRNGDIDALRDYLVTDTQATLPELYLRMNVERNDRWMPALEALLTTPGEDDALVVVGTMHLLGSDGVVEKLKAKGYKVERVCSACK